MEHSCPYAARSDDGIYILTDLHSTNGTFLNGVEEKTAFLVGGHRRKGEFHRVGWLKRTMAAFTAQPATVGGPRVKGGPGRGPTESGMVPFST